MEWTTLASVVGTGIALYVAIRNQIKDKNDAIRSQIENAAAAIRKESTIAHEGIGKRIDDLRSDLASFRTEINARLIAIEKK